MTVGISPIFFSIPVTLALLRMNYDISVHRRLYFGPNRDPRGSSLHQIVEIDTTVAPELPVDSNDSERL
jgi:hypothetical protein